LTLLLRSPFRQHLGTKPIEAHPPLRRLLLSIQFDPPSDRIRGEGIIYDFMWSVTNATLSLRREKEGIWKGKDRGRKREASLSLSPFS